MKRDLVKVPWLGVRVVRVGVGVPDTLTERVGVGCRLLEGLEVGVGEGDPGEGDGVSVVADILKVGVHEAVEGEAERDSVLRLAETRLPEGVRLRDPLAERDPGLGVPRKDSVGVVDLVGVRVFGGVKVGEAEPVRLGGVTEGVRDGEVERVSVREGVRLRGGVKVVVGVSVGGVAVPVVVRDWDGGLALYVRLERVGVRPFDSVGGLWEPERVRVALGVGVRRCETVRVSERLTVCDSETVRNSVREGL